MKTATVQLQSLSPYSQSRFHTTEKLDKETADAYEKRTWREKGHYNSRDEMCIPPMAFKLCLEAAASELAIQIPGRGKKTYKSAFKNGTLIVDEICLGVHKDDVLQHWVHCNADGVRGSGKRVMRAFPTVDEWNATLRVHVVNNSITEDVFERHITEAGQYIGIGQFRPQNGGTNGRFAVRQIKWADAD